MGNYVKGVLKFEIWTWIWKVLGVSDHLPLSSLVALLTNVTIANSESTERRYAVAIFLHSVSLDLFTRITLIPLTQVFFCKYNDPIYVKMEKLEIMIKLASDRNIDQVCQSYHCICPLSHTHHHIKRHFKLIKASFLLHAGGYYSRWSIPCCCWRSLNIHLTVAVVQTTPQFSFVVWFCHFLRFRVPLFHVCSCYIVRSEISITLLSGILLFLFRFS